MNRWADIRYRDFWDEPKVFLVRYDGTLYMFDCPFNEAVEDFGSTYTVYRMPELSDEQVAGAWTHFAALALECLGEIPIADVQFDPTKRRQVDTSILNALTPRPASVSG